MSGSLNHSHHLQEQLRIPEAVALRNVVQGLFRHTEGFRRFRNGEIVPHAVGAERRRQFSIACGRRGRVPVVKVFHVLGGQTDSARREARRTLSAFEIDDGHGLSLARAAQGLTQGYGAARGADKVMVTAGELDEIGPLDVLIDGRKIQPVIGCKIDGGKVEVGHDHNSFLAAQQRGVATSALQLSFVFRVVGIRAKSVVISGLHKAAGDQGVVTQNRVALNAVRQFHAEHESVALHGFLNNDAQNRTVLTNCLTDDAHLRNPSVRPDCLASCDYIYRLPVSMSTGKYRLSVYNFMPHQDNSNG